MMTACYLGQADKQWKGGTKQITSASIDVMNERWPSTIIGGLALQEEPSREQ